MPPSVFWPFFGCLLRWDTACRSWWPFLAFTGSCCVFLYRLLGTKDRFSLLPVLLFADFFAALTFSFLKFVLPLSAREILCLFKVLSHAHWSYWQVPELKCSSTRRRIAAGWRSTPARESLILKPPRPCLASRMFSAKKLNVLMCTCLFSLNRLFYLYNK